MRRGAAAIARENAHSQAIRTRMAQDELAQQLLEAAADQPHPSARLADVVQRSLTFHRHIHRDRTRDVLRPLPEPDEDAE